MGITQQITTAEQLSQAGDIGRCELVRGELIKLSPAKPTHGRVAMRIGSRLDAYVEAHGLGTVYAAETGFHIERDPDTVLGPDVAFVRKDRLPTPEPDHFLELAPDLAVEVLSPSDRPGRTARKIADWLHAGCRLLWIVDPAKRTVTAHRPEHPPQVLHPDDTLDGGEIVPGFQLPLGEVFG